MIGKFVLVLGFCLLFSWKAYAHDNYNVHPVYLTYEAILLPIKV